MSVIFDNTYARLPERFYARLAPTPVSAPEQLRLNTDLAAALGLDPHWLSSAEGLAMLSGNRVPAGAAPLAMAYAGHQFGNFVPQLGDGRALLLGEVVDAQGQRWDLQLKGSGRTPFSRMGDGRSALGPALREYVVSEAMHALGVPTTRALAVLRTGEAVFRETALPGGLLVRVARGHLRVGSFEYFAARHDRAAIETLTNYAIERLYPDAAQASVPALALLAAVQEAQARLIARWMQVGFIHGVMNTDNMALSGETIDYGPCAFMDHYHPATVYSSIDLQGRYAYANQPHIAQWNLARLAETLLGLIADDQNEAVALAKALLERFPRIFEDHWLAGMRAKLGLETAHPGDADLVRDYLQLMQAGQADFTLSFRRLSTALHDDEPALLALFSGQQAEVQAWLARWRQRLTLEASTSEDIRTLMDQHNPARIPRNHQLEAVIEAAVDREDYDPFHHLVDALARPYRSDASLAEYDRPPRPDEVVRATFCGT